MRTRCFRYAVAKSPPKTHRDGKINPLCGKTGPREKPTQRSERGKSEP